MQTKFDPDHGRGRRPTRPIRSWSYGILAAIAVVVMSASASWACIPVAVMEISPVNSGPAGTKVVIDGLRFGASPVEVRWGRFDGPLLARGTGPDFTADVIVPSSPAGLYTIVAFSRGADGSVGPAATTAEFQVTGPGGVGAGAPAAALTAHHSGSGSLAVAAGLVVALVLGAVIGRATMRRRRAPVVE